MFDISNEEKEILLNVFDRLPENVSADSNEFSIILSSIKEQFIAEEQIQAFSRVLEYLLASGYLRKTLGPIEDQKTFRLFCKTPAGKEKKNNIDELNNSLKTLHNQVIDNISFSFKHPGKYGITISTDKCEITLLTDHNGIYADKIEMEI